LYAFTPVKEIPKLQPAVENHLKFRNRLVWVKNNSTISPDSADNYMWVYEDIFYATQDDARALNSFEDNVLEYDRPDPGEYAHPTEKPTPLISHLIKQSTDPGDTVLDPFMGSGTTAVAAIQNDRDYVGFEVDAENYREVIERRIGEAKRQREADVNQDE
jgi:DNA modification methylase